MSTIPLLVEFSGLRVLIVGGGAVATRKARQFAAAGALVRVVAPQTSPELEQIILEYDLQLDARAYADGDVADAQLVVAATNDRRVNERIAQDVAAENRMVNVSDLSDGGMFAVMATHRRGGMTIGVSAGGVPAAAVRIRNAIAERFDARYADALNALTALRRAMLARGDTAGWRARSEELVGEDFCDAVESGSLNERLAEWP